MEKKHGKEAFLLLRPKRGHGAFRGDDVLSVAAAVVVTLLSSHISSPKPAAF